MKKMLVVIGLVLAGVFPAKAEPLGPGASIAQIRFTAPHVAEDAAALGVQPGASFSVQDLGGDLVLLEVIGVYCPQCHKQAPGYNTLYGRLNKGKTRGRVTMFAVAAGGTDLEVAQARTSLYRFPVVSDPDYVLHKALGEPLTPYTIICRSDGTIVWAHLGVVEDVNELYGRIRELLP